MSIAVEQASGVVACESWHKDFLRCFLSRAILAYGKLDRDPHGHAGCEFRVRSHRRTLLGVYLVSIWCRFLESTGRI